MIKILLVEDNRKLSNNVKDYLNGEFEVVQVFDGKDALAYLDADDYDVVILDLMLPEVDGMTILRHIRATEKGMAVLVLTAKEEINEKLRAFELGANDYLTKPFFMEELKARIYLVLRNMGKLEEQNRITFRDMYIDAKAHRICIEQDGETHVLDLNEKLFKLLEYLMMNADILLFKEQIFSRICGYDSDAGESIIEVYMSHLRKKLAPYGYDKYIRTKRGMGYILDSKS
ncbi:MAG: response regulator transcription factor [Clostridiales bacterium]|nr:response regulator transcription factor [Clostridiales bacterium]